MLDPENSAADKEIYDKLDPKNRDDMVKKRNNFAFADFKKSKKAFKNRKDLDNSTFHTTNLDHVNFEKSNLSSKFLFSF